MRKTFFILFLFLMISIISFGQKSLFTAGFHFSPTVLSDYFNGGEAFSSAEGMEFRTFQQFGYSAGMVIRKGITKTLAFETGLTFTQRNYRLQIDSVASDFRQEMTYRIVGYEIPFRGLFMIQASDYSYFMAGLGVSLDLFPSDVYSRTETWQHETVRYSWITGGVIANLGWEYRSAKSGIFYAGFRFHQPFGNIYLSKIGEVGDILVTSSMDLSGTFLSLDFVYYFPMKKSRVDK